MTPRRLKSLRRRLQGAIEAALEQGCYLRTANQLFNTMKDDHGLNLYFDKLGGCCLLGVVAGPQPARIEREWRIGRWSSWKPWCVAAKKLGISLDEAEALEAGFENRSSFFTRRLDPGLVALGAELRELYT